MIGTVLLAVILGLNFSACKDDDDDDNGGGQSINLNLLEGTWGLVNQKGWDKDEDDSPEEDPNYEYNYDPYNPVNWGIKCEIHKLIDNQFSLASFEYYNGKWDEESDSEIFKVEGKRIVVIENKENSWLSENESVDIIEVTANKLIIHYSYGEKGEYTETFVRM